MAYCVVSQTDLLTAKMAKMAPMRSPSRLLVAAASVEQSGTSGGLSAMVPCLLQRTEMVSELPEGVLMLGPYLGANAANKTDRSGERMHETQGRFPRPRTSWVPGPGTI